MTKEQIYDEQISPLMDQIIEICQKHKIANVCSFALEDENGEELFCTTAMLADEFDPPEHYKKALAVLYPPQRTATAMMTVTKPDGSKEIHAVL